MHFAPETEGYDDERTGFQQRAAHRPEVIFGATGESDVVAAVEYAATRGLPVAVQVSGHGLGAAMTGGVLISTRRMSGVRVDPAARTAWVEAGATWQHVIEAAAPHGLAPLSGSSPGVGAVSYTLGGGLGLLARRYGFAADHVRAFDLVTADGRARHVTEAGEPDLFWALRGGGGGLGVVTAMEIDLAPVARLFGGGLYFEVERTPDVLARWARWTETVPREMTSAVAMLPFPDLPMVPEPLRGKHVAQVQIAFDGSAAAGRELVEPLRAMGTPVRDTLHDLPYLESGAVFEEPEQPHAYLSANRLVDGLDPVATLPKLAGPSADAMCVVGLRHLGGALAEPPAVPNAVGHRGAAYSLTVLSPFEPGDENTVRATHRRVLEPWAPHVLGRSLNFSFDPLTAEEVGTAFASADHQRLVALKRRYDPDGRILANHPLV
jgi:FAD/FMN-containing dehydrogenase